MTDNSLLYNSYLSRFEDYAHAVFDRLCGNETLVSAMKYSLFNGGKRIRAVLALSFADLLSVPGEQALPISLAIECIHAYSLIHDDLPALDNDDFRRGKPSNHKVYGEAVAIIAGDALLNFAYETLFSLKGERARAAARYVADCAGYCGMLGGQAYDLQSENASGEDYLYKIDEGKTCALIKAPVVAMAYLAGRDIRGFEKFGEDLGLLFQFTDDILDVTGDSAKLGKTVGKDQAENKLTAVSVYGLDGAKERVTERTRACVDFLRDIPDSEFIVWLVKKISKRDR